MPITRKDSVKSITHKHGGNGYAVVEWIKDRPYVRLASFDKDTVDNRAFLAHMDMIQVEMEPEMKPDSRGLLVSTGKVVERLIPPAALVKIQEISKAIQSGELIVKNARIVAVK